MLKNSLYSPLEDSIEVDSRKKMVRVSQNYFSIWIPCKCLSEVNHQKSDGLVFCALKVVFMVLVNKALSQDCSKPYWPKMPHVYRSSCKIQDGKEYSTFDCEPGYEFSSKKLNKTIETFDGHLEKFLQCTSTELKHVSILSLWDLENVFVYFSNRV